MAICKCGNEITDDSLVCAHCGVSQRKRRVNSTRMILAGVIFILGILTGIALDRAFYVAEKKAEKLANKSQDSEGSEKAKGKQDEKDANMMVLFTSDKKEETPVEPVNVEPASKAEKPAADVNLAQALSENLKQDEENFKQKLKEEKQEVVKELSLPQLNVKSENLEEGRELAPVKAYVDSIPLKKDEDKIVQNEMLSVEKELVVQAPQKLQEPQEPQEKKLVVESKLDHKLVVEKAVTLEAKNRNNYHGAASAKGHIFVSDREKVNGKFTYQCYLKESTGRAAGKLFSWEGNVWTPEFVPGQNKVVFSSDKDAPEHIYIMDLETNEGRALTKGRDKNMMPALSPRGDKIAFVSNRGGRNAIWVMGIDGADPRRVTSGAYDDREPRWAEQGNAIIFTRIHQTLKKSHILKVELGTNKIENLVDTNDRNWLADMSPDGRFLLFTKSESKTGSMNAIILKDMHLNTQEKLNIEGAENLRPIWDDRALGFVFHKINKSGRSLHQVLFKWEKL